MKKPLFTILLILMGNNYVLADHIQDRNDDRYDYARVVAAEPVYEQIAERTPQQECRIETVRYDQPRYESRSATGTIVGAMLGAAIGNQIGRDKHGRKIGRTAGAILGASVGHDASRRTSNHSNITEYRDEERCETHYTTRYKEQLVGYDVSYRYHGKLYHTRMNQHPGREIRVVVDVKPAY